MLQLSYFPNYLQFLGSMVLLIVIFIAVFFWGMRKTIRKLQNSSNFTDLEVAAIQRQLLALLVGAPATVLFLVLVPLFGERPSPLMFLIGLVLGFAPLAYIAMSAIKNRVAIGGRPLPTQGTRAVRSGIINLVFVILVFTVSAIYLISLM